MQIFYILPLAVVWLFWAALKYLTAMPDWFTLLVFMFACGMTGVVAFTLTLINGASR